MILLQDILTHVPVVQAQGSLQQEVSGICLDSRQAAPGMMFIAIPGTHTDGHRFLDQVVAAGSTIIVCQQLPETLVKGVTYIQVKDSAAVAGLIAAAFYGFPAASLKVVGVTGTNGKTTCATLLFQLFTELGYACGLLSTVVNRIREQVLPATHTTPDPVSLQAALRQMLDAGCTHVFMEVSSHAIHQQRINGIEFTGACFTNITHDHLDYHQNFDEYIRVKKSFFDTLPTTSFALVNADDKRGSVMVQNTLAAIRTFSLRTLADYKGKILENNLSGLVMQLGNQEVYFRLIGEFNASNILCVWGAACELGEDSNRVLQVLSTLPGAEGRFETIRSPREHILGIVDYAHTPDALLNVLATINKIRKGEEMLLTVVGCGGDRDKTKRPIMALAACEHSDKVIFTSDNPRSEDPLVILNEMEAGVPVHQQKKYLSIPDRREAIKTACTLAHAGDIILVAGKGHETYQEIQGVRHPFDDKQMLHELFSLLEK